MGTLVFILAVAAIVNAVYFVGGLVSRREQRRLDQLTEENYTVLRAEDQDVLYKKDPILYIKMVERGEL